MLLKTGHWFLQVAYSFWLVIEIPLTDGQETVIVHFRAVQQGGRPQCCTDPPALTQRVRSRVDCSKQCVTGQDGESGAAFNFKQSLSRCELFDAAPTYNYTEIPGCTMYQVVDFKCTRAPQA